MPKMVRKPRGRSAIVLWERDPKPGMSAIELLDGSAPGFRLQEEDFEILDLVLRYNFATVAQLYRYWRNQVVDIDHDKRLKRRLTGRVTLLHAQGLLDRAWIRYRPKTPVAQLGGTTLTRKDFVGEWVYALSVKGMDVLWHNGDDNAQRWRDDWQPRSLGQSYKLSIEHELGRNDVALALLEAASARSRPCAAWLGPREAYHRIAPPTPGAPWQTVEPDGVILLDTGRPLLLEYERSGRADKFLRKVRAMRLYLASGGWKERYALAPWVIYAIPSVTRTERRYAGSFGALAAQTRTSGAPRYLLLDELAWEGDVWEARDGKGDYVPFWDTVWSA